ncbi:hypothetical protein lerEdw1_016848 [Lerista edwardsae]|nr:hypothetical protein lerEdw1_016848 [Lerista edwardsae]
MYSINLIRLVASLLCPPKKEPPKGCVPFDATSFVSLAQQWSAEDEEELERERRRRHRQLSSTSDVKEETPEPVKNSVSKAPNRHVHAWVQHSPEVKPPKLGSPKLENERRPVERLKKLEDSWVRRKVEALNNVKQEKKETVNARKWEKAADKENTKSLAEAAQKPKNPATEKCPVQSWQKDPAEDKRPNRSQEKREPRKGQCENSDQEAKDLKMEEDDVFNQKQKALDVQKSPRLVTLRNEGATKPPQRASWERRSVSRLEVKIHSRVRNSSESAPATSASGPRVVSRKDPQEDTLNRSASMRLPASTTKLEEKRERYTSAVQRAGSIKLPPSARRNFQPLAEGVASKRSIFEAQVRAEPTTPIRKESLKIPGGVTSRINLWISRTQEPSKDEGAKM